ncbi:hypothetical protein ACFL58_04000, partial [Elusimicrobiota bacterium]
EEFSPRYNHYLAVGIEKDIKESEIGDKPQKCIDEVNRQGGVGLISHPDHKGPKRFKGKDYPWTDWSVSGYQGISIWDFQTDWQEKLVSVPRALLSYVFPSWSLSGPKTETLKRWDELNQTKRILGFGEIDCHNFKKTFYGFKTEIFPFDYSFSTIRTHVLLNSELSKDCASAKKQIVEALRQSRAYVAQETWNRAHGFSFSVYDQNIKAVSGDTFKLGKDTTKIEVAIPKKGMIKLIRNGNVLGEYKNKQYFCSEIKDPGVYRVEVLKKVFGKNKPWIYSNPIRVTKDE